MKPRITIITLGVDNLKESLAFYRDGLGLPTQGIVGEEFEHGTVAFFDLQSGLKLAIWSRDDIAHDSGIPKSKRGPTIGHNVATKEEVDAVMEQAKVIVWVLEVAGVPSPKGTLGTLDYLRQMWRTPNPSLQWTAFGIR